VLGVVSGELVPPVVEGLCGNAFVAAEGDHRQRAAAKRSSRSIQDWRTRARPRRGRGMLRTSRNLQGGGDPCKLLSLSRTYSAGRVQVQLGGAAQILGGLSKFREARLSRQAISRGPG